MVTTPTPEGKPTQPEPMKAWIIVDADRYLTHIVIGIEADAQAAAMDREDWFVDSGPYDFTIAVKP